MNVVQSAILLGIGLQRKSVDTMVSELDLPSNQLLALFNKAIRRLSEYLDSMCVDAIREKIEGENAKKRTGTELTTGQEMQPVQISLEVVSCGRFLRIKKRGRADLMHHLCILTAI